jgi:polysaccharide pyruvyl transferase WcaK-like protein
VFDAVAGTFGWQLRQVWDAFDEASVAKLNETVSALVIGGGGFIIRDQQGGDIDSSGWLWNISMGCLDKLEKPLILFAVGYNRFRNQPDFDRRFNRHITRTLEKCIFAGLRNTGSIREVRRYVEDPALAEKLRLQYCPTTVSWQIFPEATELARGFDAEKRDNPVLAFNFAYDRPSMRFGEQEDQILKRLAEVMKRADRAGWKIVLTAHKVIDRAIETYLDGAGVSYATHDLTEATYSDILAHYAEVDLAIGMRGHGQMIPFGLRRPILSLVSHNKMAYFLEDIERPEWGIELAVPDLVDRLWDKIECFGMRDYEQTRRDVAKAQEKVWNLTRENVAWIADKLDVGIQRRK